MDENEEGQEACAPIWGIMGKMMPGTQAVAVGGSQIREKRHARSYHLISWAS